MTYTKFLNCENLDSFNSNLESGVITDSCIVFIQDPKQIWTHGQFYPCPYKKEEIDSIVSTEITKEKIESLLTGNITSHTHDQYLTEESDPTVPGWAKSPTKPTYTASEVGAAKVNHTHDKSQITNFPSSLPNPSSLVLKVNSGGSEGTSLYTYNGSSSKSLDIKSGSNVTFSSGSGSLTISAKDTTYSEATSSKSGLMSSSDKSKLNGIQSGAQVNSVTSVAGRTGEVTLNKSDVGLGNVTNESKATMFTNAALTGTPTAPTAATSTNNTQIATTAFVQSVVNNKIAASDAMIYKGTIGSTGSTVTSLPTTYNTGWTYKVVTAGTYAGQKCEVGDMIIALVDRSGSGTSNSDWTVIQTNIDGAVTGPSSSIDSHVATFSGSTGRVIKDSGFTIASSVPANAKFTDTIYTHPTSSGNKHIPSGGSSGQILRWSSDGTAVWGNDNNTTYGQANSTTLGLIKIGFSESGKNYPVELNSSGQAYVNVPWTDTNTTYGVATPSSNGLMSSSDKSKLDGIQSGANRTTIDSSLSSSSTNPVQNKVINSALSGKANTSGTYTGITSGSSNKLNKNTTISNLDTYVPSTTVGQIVTFDCPSSVTGRPSLSGTQLGGIVFTPYQDYHKVIAFPASAGDSAIMAIKEINAKTSNSKWRYVPTGDSAGNALKANSVPWTGITGKPSSFTPSSHTHTISQISDLNSSWDDILKTAPSSYVTRNPTISEVSNKQNLVLKVNSGTTEGTNQYTYNATASKVLDIKAGSNVTLTASNGSLTISSTNTTYGVVGGNGSTGLIKNGSSVTSNSGYTPCPIISGIPYYKDTNNTYTLSSFGITATATELNYCDGVTSNIQTQLNGKASSSHTHTISQISDLNSSWDSLLKSTPSGYVTRWPAWNEVTGKPATFTPSSHSHNTLDCNELSGTVNLSSINLSSGSPEKALYICKTDGGGSNITGRPNDNDKKAFILTVELIRWASTSDYITKQTYIKGSEKKVWERYCTNGSWSSWSEIYTSSNKPTASEIGAAVSSHTHDDRYYTESEMNTKLNSKANTNQTMYIGTTAVAINRSSASLTLNGVNVSGSSGSCTGNAVTASKLGTSSVGSASVPIYLNAGTATQCTASSLFSNLSNSGNNISITVAGQNRTLTPAYASHAGYADYVSRDRGSNTVTTLSNLPINKSLVIANLSGATSISVQSGMNVGESITIICNPSTNFTQPIPSTGSYKSMDGDSLSVKSGKQFEINIYCYASSSYSISCKVSK